MRTGLLLIATLLTGAAASGYPQPANPPGSPARTMAENQEAARLTYTKVLKGSVPEYLAITINTNGTGTYEGRTMSDPPDPKPLKLSVATTHRLFDLADALGYFKSVDLDSHKKVADMGLKTLVYEAGGERNQAQFNYTQRREAQELADTFEKIGAVEQHLAALQYEVKYDHLGLPRELLQIQIDLDNKALADPQLLVPALDEIVRNPRFLHLAQARAQNILDRLGQNPGANAE